MAAHYAMLYKLCPEYEEWGFTDLGPYLIIAKIPSEPGRYNYLLRGHTPNIIGWFEMSDVQEL
jgi:hypothetical protein